MSTRAVLYTRVSTDEQADRGYSLRDQESRLRQYCRRQNIEVVQHFQDDHSAKTFDRPAFQRLLAFLRANRGGVDQVLFVKWDRFSRSLNGALQMIQLLGDELSVDPQAIEQPVDRRIPEQLMMLAIYVAAPEVENMRRSLATKSGMRRAMREGRWCNMAPIGYENTLDDRKQKVIAPNHKADFIREAFELAATHPHLPMEELRRQLVRNSRKRGDKFQISRNRFTQILRDPIYIGKIRIPAWRDEPEEIVEAQHEGIIPEHVFYRVQHRFDRDLGKQTKSKLVPELILRGHLLCPSCSELLTGSGSSGNGGRYWYYHCHHCKKTRFRAEEANDEIRRYLRSVQISRRALRLHEDVIAHMTESEAGSRERRIRKLRTTCEAMEEKLFKIDEAFIDGTIEQDSYSRLKSNCAAQLRDASVELAEMEDDGEGFASKLNYTVRLLSNLGQTYNNAEPETKRAILVRIFPERLIYLDGSFRTSPPSDIIALLSPKTQKTKDAGTSKDTGVSRGSPEGTAFEPSALLRKRVGEVYELKNLLAA